MPSSKLAVSLPESLFQDVERERKRRGLSRSAVIQRSLRAWVRAQVEGDKVKRYVEAHRRDPETDAEVAESEAMIRFVLAADD